MNSYNAVRSIARTAGLLALDTLVALTGSLGRAYRTSDDIAVVRLDAIGDFVLWLQAAKALRGHFGRNRMVLVANSVWSEFAREIGIWDDVWPVSVPKFRRDLRYRAAMISRIRRAGFDVAVNTTHSRIPIVDDALIRATGARRRVGSTGDCANTSRWKKALSDRVYTELVPVPGPGHSELERHAAYLSALEVEGVRAEVADLRSCFSGENSPVLNKAPYFVIVPGAGWHGRRWPPDRFAAVADHLARAHGLQGVICGAASERGIADEVVQVMQTPVLDMVGKTELGELAQVIKGARIVVSNDTSAVHIAASLAVPCVSMLGGGQYGRFAPYKREWKAPGPLPVSVHVNMECFGCDWACIFDVRGDSAAPCVDRIRLDEVITVLDGILSEQNLPLDYALVD